LVCAHWPAFSSMIPKFRGSLQRGFETLSEILISYTPPILSQSNGKPALKWAGGKSQLLGQLLPYFPKGFARYLEPFLGGGAVWLKLDPQGPCLLSDSNQELINLYQVIQDNPELLMKKLDKLTENYSEEFYYELRQTQPKPPVDKAARTLFLNKTGFNGLYRQNRKGEFNVPFGKREKCPALYDPQNLLALSQRLLKANLYCMDFEELLDQAGEGDFVYCDPPYEPLSATSNFKSYTHSGFTQDDQIRLRDACARAAKRGAYVAVSNSHTPFILELYSWWEIHELTASRNINSNGKARGKISEILALLSPPTA
jgi:DNA adenine methylase